MVQAQIEELLGYAVNDSDAAEVDPSFLPPSGEANPFEAAVAAGQADFAELHLQGLFAEVLAGTRNDGAGDLYCPAFAPGERAAVIEWHHDEQLAWNIAASSFDELSIMLSVLDELERLSVDKRAILGTIQQAGTRDAQLQAIEDPTLRAAFARWPSAPPPKSYDFSPWQDLLASFARPAAASLEVANRASARLRRAAWIVSALTTGEPHGAPSDPELGRILDELLARPTLGTADQLYALWASWLTGRDAQASLLCGRGLESPSSLVRDAAVAVRRALGGDATIGEIDLGPARAALIARTIVRPGELTQDEISARKPSVRTLLIPTRHEWNPGISEYTGLEILETAVQVVPPELGGLRTLRRFTCKGRMPAETSQLVELEELECMFLPPSAAGLGKLRTLHLGEWEGEASAATIAGLASLEELVLSSGSEVVLPDTWSAIPRLRTLNVTAGGPTERVHLSTAIAALPALETLTVRGKVDDLPADWSQARALREVTFYGTPPANLGVLAKAPALRSVVIEPFYYAPVPDLSAFTELDLLRIWGNVDDLRATARAIRGVRKLRRLDYRGNEKGQDGLPEELLGIEVEELRLDLPFDSSWGEIERLIRSIPALRALTLAEGPDADEEDAAPPASSAWTGIEYLDLQNAYAPLPIAPDLAGFPDLRELVLGRSSESWVKPQNTEGFLDGLAACARLEVARLAGVALRPVDIAALGALSSLRELDLVQCGITALPDGFAARAPLAVLDLRGNPLAELPASIGALPLRVLRIGGTSITSLDELPAPTALEHLDLTSPALARAPAWLGQLSALRKLELGGPALDLEHALALACELPALRELVIRDARHDGIPPSMFRMLKLDRLEVHASDFQTPLVQLRVRFPTQTLILA